MSRYRLLPSLAGAVGLLVAPAAYAQATPEQAKALEQQIRSWLSGMLGPTVDVSALAMKFTPDGANYRVEIPLDGPVGTTGVTIAATPLTALAKPLDGGRWAIDELRYPSPVKISFPQPKAGAPATPNALPVSMTIEMTDQDHHIILDPTLATTSTFDAKLGSYTSTTQTPAGVQTTRIERLSGRGVLQPQAGGQQLMTSESVGERFTSRMPMPDGSEMVVSGDRLRVTMKGDRVDLAQYGRIIRTALTLAGSAKDAKPGADMTPADKDMAHALVVALANLFGSMEGEESIDGLQVKFGAFGGKISRLVMGGSAAAPNGVAEMRMHYSVEGLDSPMIPPGVYREFLPRKVTMDPRIGGVPKEDLVAVLQYLIDHGSKDDNTELQAKGMELMAKGPLVVGLDNVLIDLGLASLTAEGEVTIPSPAEISADAEIRVTGLDALIKRISSTPELKMAMPVLTFLKGLGKADGKQTVWKIAYEDNKLTVNGNDMSSMIPGR